MVSLDDLCPDAICGIVDHIVGLGPNTHEVCFDGWDVKFRVDSDILGGSQVDTIAYSARNGVDWRAITAGGYTAYCPSNSCIPVVSLDYGATKPVFLDIACNRLKNSSAVLIPALVKLADRTNYVFDKP